MKLAEWMQENGLGDDALADLLGIDRTTVSRYRRDVAKPSAAVFRRLAEVTSGLVMPNDFFLDDDHNVKPPVASSPQKGECLSDEAA